jgi:hypothetical protein
MKASVMNIEERGDKEGMVTKFLLAHRVDREHSSTDYGKGKEKQSLDKAVQRAMEKRYCL